MAYEFISKYDSPNFGYPRGAKGQNKPDKIIIHHWGQDGQSFQGVINWLCRSDVEAGAHFVIEEGRAACLIDYPNAAWGAGDRPANCSSIQMECRPECSAGDFQTVAEVIADIYKVYDKKLPLYGHKDFMATACPGRYYSRLNELYQRACKIYDGSTPEPVKKGITVDGIAGPETVNAWQRFCGTEIDGVISGQNPEHKKLMPNITAIEWNDIGSMMVAAWQRYISGQGFPAYDDGYLGPVTNKATQRFFNRWWGHNAAVDAVIGPVTVTQLQRFLNFKLYQIK